MTAADLDVLSVTIYGGFHDLWTLLQEVIS